MTDKTVTHEIKLDKSLKTILWALAIGVVLNAVPQQFLTGNDPGEIDVLLKAQSYVPFRHNHTVSMDGDMDIKVSNGDIGFRIVN
tara:strand:+ start:409 stop:663 length:255 start_codon:yes stop_codon:yes gene_type:complete